tara:strand:+ start:1399 stop:2022 length:624 start_codon:yes stop_codon:yes gene_type:complete
MTLKERISDLFEKYSVELEVEEKEEVQMATAKLESGQEIMTDAESFAVGVEVFVMNDENEKIPLPNGDYSLEDGTSLKVEDGKVSEMEAKTEAEEDEKEEDMAYGDKDKDEEKMSEEPKAEEVEEVEASAEVLTREDVAGMIAEAIEATKAEFSSQIEERDAKITELSKQATPSLSRAPKMEVQAPVDLKSLSIQERVAAIHNQFSK